MPSRCPSTDELERLLKGGLAENKQELLEAHVEECEACRKRLDALAGAGRSWVASKCRPDAPKTSPELRAAMEGLKADDPLSTIVISAEHSGELVGGRYKLLQRLGEGGMGEVWMAEQEKPVRRRVALKIIKLGMDTKEVVARFEAERQALAMMDHPNIAKVLDGGATESGRPYFVMELVRGVRITAYCDQNNLSTLERLKLFIPICQAIQHAHQKGIIHRDIKPSNILVTLNDGVPVPKVIDFGIAKATGARLTDKTLFTRLNAAIGTPTYMSPEQAEMTSLDVDTRSDIYSLGVLLYELLTGSTPFNEETLFHAGVEGMCRVLREVDPPRPSTRVSTMKGEELMRIAKQRQTEAPKLINVLRGDLDWVVMKCLEKDRTRRYGTASALADEVQRHLGNEPVEARPPSAAYRFKKLLRRRRAAVLSAAGILVALMLGLVGTTSMFWRERLARKEADEAEKEQANQTAKANALSDQLKQHLREAAWDSFHEADRVLLEAMTSLAAAGKTRTTKPDSLEKAKEWRRGMLLLQRALKFDPLNATAAERLGNELMFNRRFMAVLPDSSHRFSDEFVTVSAEARFVLAESANRLRVTDLTGSQDFLTLERPGKLPPATSVAAISADGEWLAASVSRANSLAEAQIWSLLLNRMVTVLGNFVLEAPVFSADGKRLSGMITENEQGAAGDSQRIKQVAIFDRETGQLLRKTNCAKSVQWFRLGNNGRSLVTKLVGDTQLEFWKVDSSDPSVRKPGVWAEMSPASDRVLYRIDTGGNSTYSAAELIPFERDANRLKVLKDDLARTEAAGSGYSEDDMRALKLEVQMLEMRAEHYARMSAGRVSPRVIVKFAVASTGEDISELDGFVGWFAPTRRRDSFVLTGTQLGIHDATTGQRRLELRGRATSVHFSPDGESFLVLSGSGGEAMVWSTGSGTLTAVCAVPAGKFSAQLSNVKDGIQSAHFVSRDQTDSIVSCANWAVTAAESEPWTRSDRPELRSQYDLSPAHSLARSSPEQMGEYFEQIASVATGARLVAGNAVPLHDEDILRTRVALLEQSQSEGIKAEFARLLISGLIRAGMPTAKSNLLAEADKLLLGNESAARSAAERFPEHPLAELSLARFEESPQAAAEAMLRALEHLPLDKDIQSRAGRLLKVHLSGMRTELSRLHAIATQAEHSEQNSSVRQAARRFLTLADGALRLAPDDQDIRKWRLWALTIAGRHQEAVAGWKQWLATVDRDKDEISEAGYWVACAGSLDEAQKIFAEARRLYPDSSTVLRWEGFAWLKAGQLDKAEECFEAAVESIERRKIDVEPRLFAGRAIIHWLRGLTDEAVAEAEKLLKASPSWTDPTVVREEASPPMNGTDVLTEVIEETVRRKPELKEQRPNRLPGL